MRYKLGKRPATHDPRDLLLARYTPSLPVVPSGDLGHQAMMHTDWGMLGNDQYGDCVWAGADHEHILWNVEAGTSVMFTAQSALVDYTAVTGFDPKKPDTDQGTDMRQAADYRRKTGIVDASGVKGSRHKIGAYVAITPGDAAQLKQAVYFFSVGAMGFEFPSSAMDQFDAGKPWTVVKGASIEGGHYVPIVGYVAASDMFVCVTWGKLQLVAPAFIKKYMDEGYAYLTAEMLTGGKSLEGFDLATLTEDLAELGGKPAPTPTPSPTPTPTPTPPATDAIDRTAAIAALQALPAA